MQLPRPPPPVTVPEVNRRVRALIENQFAALGSPASSPT